MAEGARKRVVGLVVGSMVETGVVGLVETGMVGVVVVGIEVGVEACTEISIWK